MNTVSARRKNVFVIGLDAVHRRDLVKIPDRNCFRFHRLLEREEVLVDQDIETMIERADSILQQFDGPIDAIIGYWDFPVTALVSILCEKYELPAPPLEAVLRSAHKYWARLEQSRHLPEFTPDFCAVDPFADDPFADLTIEYPFWMKPVCGYSSALGFQVNNREDFDHAIEVARQRIKRYGDPFNTVLSRVDTSDLNGVGGNHMIAEAMMGGSEFAPEGYVRDGEVRVHGVVDMVRAPNHKSFKDYRYPSAHPQAIQERAIDGIARFVRATGYTDGCFNVEFFWDQDTDEMRLIEFNTRVSQSHSAMMAMVDGMSNYEVAIHVALGDEPGYGHGGGEYDMAAKYLYRRFDTSDARCVAAPGESDLKALRKEQPDTQVMLEVHEGMRLSELVDQDPYSWILAELIIGGDDVQDLNRKFERAKELLPFRFEPVSDAVNAQDKQVRES
ncbi:ATP-grasp domain-containing protein [Guyparkeria sp. 1SP6A2]|nr:ATP-grasp domain-containing protein [Guyparkeria sp. 1SP6A2]